MLKYVNPDFQISDLVIVVGSEKNESNFQEIERKKNNGMYLEPLNPKWLEKIMELREGCKLVGKLVGLYRDV